MENLLFRKNKTKKQKQKRTTKQKTKLNQCQPKQTEHLCSVYELNEWMDGLQNTVRKLIVLLLDAAVKYENRMLVKTEACSNSKKVFWNHKD